MQRFGKIIQFMSWPVICGVLVAIVFLQYQQLGELNQQSILVAPVQEAKQPITSFSDAISKAAPSVVSINATSVNVESIERAAADRVNLYLGERASLGSGVIISDQGYILTNLHVVDTLFDAFDTEVTLKDGRKTPATVVAWDKDKDLAVLHINMDNLAPIQIDDEQELEVGDIVFAIGYPRNIGQSVSQGIVSALTTNPDTSISIIQTDAAINPGNSGGALIDNEGTLVGINSSIFSESGNFEGIGFATPASIAIAAMEELVEQAIEGNNGYLGVLTGEALNEQSSQLFFGVNHIRGMLVENVDVGGAAERAGIEPGDVITRVEDTPVIDGQNIVMEIRNKKPGDTVTVQVYRNGQTFNFPVTLGFGEALIIEP
ncbi:MAG: 2-alkenal reductase [Gammaproteobacteria bacterium]|nr:2-alkenal reductase [Gammaproteobacteria bacterium]|tara:strand:- start:22302 stop:23426 length:1125 start_codon:yes stop_codon:yes gene_type:complete